MQYAKALLIAETIRDRLACACERIEIAGSVRRQRTECHDLDLVCIPKVIPQSDLFGNQQGEISLLDDAVKGLGEFRKDGPRHKQIYLSADEINLELWIVRPPAQWGVIMMIRTGPADWSKWIVTPRQHGGALPSFLKVQDGVIWNGKTPMDISEETDFFKLLELPYMAPTDRRPQLWMAKQIPDGVDY